MKELISIIIPVYNTEEFLLRCAESVMGQEYENIEIILIDDGSTDRSGGICDQLAERDNRIVVIHKNNGGQSSARNLGIQRSHGKYISFVDSDDVIDREYTAYLYRLLCVNDADMAICRIAHFNQGDTIRFSSKGGERLLDSTTATQEMFYQYSWLESPCNKLYKRELFDDLSFDENHRFEDSILMPRLFGKCEKIVYGESEKYAYIHRKNSTTTSKYSREQLDILWATEDLYRQYENTILEKAALSYRMTANMRVLLNAPDLGEFIKVKKGCELFIRDNWLSVFRDKNVRRKIKIALILFRLGRNNLLGVYHIVNKLSAKISHE